MAMLALTAAGAWAQVTGPVFEVAEVRIYKPDPGEQGVRGTIGINGVLTNYSQVAGQRIQPGEPVFAANGKVTMRSVTMRDLITQAYGEIAETSRLQAIQEEYLSGGPNWLDTDRFELVAKAPPGTPLASERLMLQSLLAERFHLAVHREQKPMPVYALLVGKKELKLQATSEPGDSDCKRSFVAGDGHTHATCTRISMADLASWLPRLEPFDVDQPAVDLTGIAGAYDFRLEWTPHGLDSGPAGITIFDALEKLGLRLQARKEPMPVIVIDHVDRVPTDN
jgi:uncharacterized protein (TIGR03435 family)